MALRTFVPKLVRQEEREPGTCEICNKEQPETRKLFHTFETKEFNTPFTVVCKSCERLLRTISKGSFSCTEAAINLVKSKVRIQS